MALYYLAAAVMQPVCDKRLAACMAQNAVGHGMLLEIVGYSLALFAVDHRSDQLFYECGVLCGMSCCHTAFYQGGCAKCEQQRRSGGAA